MQKRTSSLLNGNLESLKQTSDEGVEESFGIDEIFQSQKLWLKTLKMKETPIPKRKCA